MATLLLYSAVLGAGLTGYAITVRLGLDDSEAWAAGRVAGLVAVALPAWWCGWLGLAAWQVVGMVLLLAGMAAGVWTVWQRRAAWRQLLAAEGIFLLGCLVLLLLRLGRPEIQGQEKPMDLGILASLLRSESFPPPDMWLAGASLPYYYWGALLWIVPLAVSGLELDMGYNLIVALNCGLVTVVVWMLGRRLAGSHAAGATAAFFAVLAGTPDGLRQLLATRSLGGIEIWQSSRQVSDTITEFPLFSHWLGDLHPHLLCMPLAGLAMLLALHLGATGITLPGLTALAAVFGVTWAANPWAMPPTLAAVAVLLLSGDGSWHWPEGEGRWRWLAVLAVAVAAWLLTAPFHLSFQPPFQGLWVVHAWTPPQQLLLYAGCLLLPVLLVVLRQLRAWFAGPPLRSLALTLGLLCLVILAGVITDWGLLLLVGAGFGLAAAAVAHLRQEPGSVELVAVLAGFMAVLLILALGSSGAAMPARTTFFALLLLLLVLAAASVCGPATPQRPALALAGLGILLLLVPEVLYVIDAYGDQLHRMNTVFKAYIQGWIFLAVALPVLLQRALPSRRSRVALLAVLVLVALPHLLCLGLPLLAGAHRGLDGLAWLPAGDRVLVQELRRQPPGTTMIEAVGGAYSRYGRLSSASGVPALLGWANHEGVWRGAAISPELERRRRLVEELYSAEDVATVRRLVHEAGVDLVAIGSLERSTYAASSLATIAGAGEVVLEAEGAQLVRFARGSP